jgi:bacillithiol system protein YtxJ
MGKNVNEIGTIEEFDKLLAQSMQQPILLFKHSLTCPISERAFREFESFIEAADLVLSCNLITVQTARRVSDEAAARLNVQHETPQAILVRNGREIWNASHFAITSQSLKEALRSVE